MRVRDAVGGYAGPSEPGRSTPPGGSKERTTPLRELVGLPGYRPLLLAATLSRLADEMAPVAIVLLVVGRTGSIAAAGATMAMVTLPAAVVGLFAGRLLDRTRHLTKLLGLYHVAAVVCLTGMLLAPASAGSWPYPLLAFPIGATTPLGSGGFLSLTLRLVDERRLPLANDMEAVSFNVAAILGPALAGALIALRGAPLAIAAEALLTLAVVPLLAQIGSVDHMRARATSSLALGRSLATGLRAALGPVPLRAVLLAGLVSMAGTGMLVIALPFYAQSLGQPRAAAGLFWSVWACAAVVGVLVGSRLLRGYRPEHIVVACVGVLGLVTLTWPWAGNVVVAAVLVAGAGLADGPGLAATYTARQRWCERSRYGEVTTISAGVKFAGFAAGSAAAGVLLGSIGLTALLFVAGGVQVIGAAGAALLLLKPVPPAADAHLPGRTAPVDGAGS